MIGLIKSRSHQYMPMAVRVEMARRYGSAEIIIGINGNITTTSTQNIDDHTIRICEFNLINKPLTWEGAHHHNGCIGNRRHESFTILHMISGNTLEILHGKRLHQLNADAFDKFIFADVKDDVLAFALSGAEIAVTVQGVHHFFPGGIGNCAVVVHDTVDCPNIDTDFIGDCLKLNPVHNPFLSLDFLYNYTILHIRIQGRKRVLPDKNCPICDKDLPPRNNSSHSVSSGRASMLVLKVVHVDAFKFRLIQTEVQEGNPPEATFRQPC
ncbi:MAG: hypothetical protein L6W00_22560 [Lentisphaeria bacterium]|nr:MAG: hypothetical protein L6W00_22560 [Lentisphaeria bacterium]